MKLKSDDTIEVESIGSDMLDMKSSISAENIPLVLSLVSKGIYSNPIGSIIREITSNCVDANTELGERKPILVNINYDHENQNYYIEFIDKGIGMSEDRIQKIYTNFFSSTKRGTDDLIGGFGLGSKSCLSYNDIFYITTIFDNIKYEYVYFKDGDNYTLSLMNKYNVLEKSGTTIRLDIKDGDVGNFLKEIKQQLSYFKDIYINTCYSNYNNDFKIYEGNIFKFKSIDRPYENLHIVLGEVTYPIDYKLLNIPEIKIPLALKFNVGELRPTLERENIKYDDESKSLIKQKIGLLLDELKEYFKEQTFELTDLKEYFLKKEESPILYFDEEKIHGIKAYREYFGKSSYIFKSLENIKIPNDNIFFMYSLYNLSNQKIYNQNSIYEFERAWKRGVKLMTKEEHGFNSASTSYFTSDHLILIPKKNSYKDAIRILNLNSYKYNKIGYSYGLISGASFYQELHEKNEKGGYTLGSAQIIHKYITEIKNYVNSVARKYEDVPLEYLENYKEEKRQEYLEAKTITKERVVYKDEFGSYQDIRLSNLLKTKFIFYCLKDENFDINLFKEIIKRSNFKSSDFVFINLSNTQYQKIKKYKLIHMSKFIESKKLQNTLYKIKLANYIRYKIGYDELMSSKISKYHHDLWFRLKNFVLCYELNLKDLKANTHKRKHNCCWKITKDFKEYLEILPKFNILDYINLYHIPEHHLKTIIKTMKITKLNSNLYK